MLILLFYLGETMYAIRCEKVREVAPMVKLKAVPNLPPFFAGLFNYRGKIVPVVDLCQLIHQRPCKMRLSTRIILIDELQADGTATVLGFLAERVTEAVMKPEDALIHVGTGIRQSPYLEGVIMEQDEMIYTIDVKKLSESLSYLSDLPENRSGGPMGSTDMTSSSQTGNEAPRS